jgi:hypothetical protein
MQSRKYCFAPAHRRELHHPPNIRLFDDVNRLALKREELRGWRPHEEDSIHAPQCCLQGLRLVVVYRDDFNSGRVAGALLTD